MSEIQIGDVCRSKNGKYDFTVTAIYSRKIHGTYLHNGGQATFDKQNVILSTNQNNSATSGIANGMRVRHINADGDVIEGCVIGIKKSGDEIVIEKDNGVILVYSKDDVEEIVAYTATVLDLAANRKEDFIFDKGSIDLGEIVVYMGGGKTVPYVGQIVLLDTKNKKVTKKFIGKKVDMKPL